MLQELKSSNLFILYSRERVPAAGPVAQSVERWTPRSERTRPSKKCPGFEADGRFMFMGLLAGMVTVGGRP